MDDGEDVGRICLNRETEHMLSKNLVFGRRYYRERHAKTARILRIPECSGLSGLSRDTKENRFESVIYSLEEGISFLESPVAGGKLPPEKYRNITHRRASCPASRSSSGAQPGSSGSREHLQWGAAAARRSQVATATGSSDSAAQPRSSGSGEQLQRKAAAAGNLCWDVPYIQG